MITRFETAISNLLYKLCTPDGQVGKSRQPLISSTVLLRKRELRGATRKSAIEVSLFVRQPEETKAFHRPDCGRLL